MEIEDFIKKLKDIYPKFIDFIDNTDDLEIKFQVLIDSFEKHEILEKKEGIRQILKLIAAIANNHYRTTNFFNKLEKIIQYLLKDKKSPISDYIPDYRLNFSKRILFYLFEKEFIEPDESFFRYFFKQRKSNEKLFYYLYPALKKYLSESEQKHIESEIFKKFKVPIDTFKAKCLIGENDSYICSLIREDSIESFITFINQSNISLSYKIRPSYYETNAFLIGRKTSLIEYATFFGAIRIIQYLKFNKIENDESLWPFAVHSNNAELIHYLEENEAFNSFEIRSSYLEYLVKESIICNHNEFADYFRYNYLEKNSDFNEFIDFFCWDILFSSDLFYFPDDIELLISRSAVDRAFKIPIIHFSFKKITIPSSVTSIGDNAFNGSYGSHFIVKEIIIPSSVTSFGEASFFWIRNLKKIIIPSSVTSIGDFYFAECPSLLQITIPSSVTSIGKYAFLECSSLTNITFETPCSISQISDHEFDNCSSLQQIAIPSSVTKIGKFAFVRCSSLTQVTIPSSVTDIDELAFSRCESLEQIFLPSSVINIGKCAFSECSSLKQISIPSSVASIGEGAFYRCSSLTEVSIHSSTTSIKENAFLYCSSLIQMTIPSSLSIDNLELSSSSIRLR